MKRILKFIFFSLYRDKRLGKITLELTKKQCSLLIKALEFYKVDFIRDALNEKPARRDIMQYCQRIEDIITKIKDYINEEQKREINEESI